MDELTFQRQFKPDGPPTLADVFARALLPDREELAEAAAAKAEADALAERREQLALANAMNGNPLAELSRAQTAAAAARDTVRDLEARLADAREVLSRAEGNVAAWAGQADDVMAQVARRSSAEADLLAPAKAAHLEYVQATRAAWAAAQAGRPRRERRPFSAGGTARRSDQPVECPECVAAGASAEESFLIHADPDPAPVPDDFEPEPGWPVQRRGYDHGMAVR